MTEHARLGAIAGRVRRDALALTVTAGLALAGFLVLTILVSTHRTDRVDQWFRRWSWPSQHWGSRQEAADDFANWLDPELIAAVVIAVALVITLRRRSWRTVALTAGVIGVVSALELGMKTLLPDLATSSPSTRPVGAFPSGHVLAAIAFPGALVLAARWRLAAWAGVALFGLAMSAAALVSVIHWITDVVGSILLAVSVLCAAGATAPPTASWLPRRPGRRPAERRSARE